MSEKITIYDVINFIEKKYPILKQYDADTMATAYRIPYDIWIKTTGINKKTIELIDKNLSLGRICLWDNCVFMLYDR